VSREIHDTITQGLASSLLLLEAAGRAWPEMPPGQDLGQATALLRGNLSETRSLVHELASPGLDASPLPDALLFAAASQYAPDARLLVTGEPRPVAGRGPPRPPRVVQSAAPNIKLHAAASDGHSDARLPAGRRHLDVYDDGAGFDPAAAAPPSDAGGYGLRAMRQRVEQLGGVFSVESAPGEGTVVAAQLPARQRRKAKNETPSPCCWWTTTWWCEAGCGPCWARSPISSGGRGSVGRGSAGRSWNRHAVSVVVMDLAMGHGMDGIEAIRRIRERNKRQAILVFTTYDSDADIVRAVDAGAMGYLLKDAAPDEIFAAIRGAVQGKSVMSPPWRPGFSSSCATLTRS
jgi:CheY-like chemotaxis protein